jgi:hypothetical protein
MIRFACVLLGFAVILVRCGSGPAGETLTPSVSSRIATHSDDPTYAVVAEQHNRSIDINSEFKRLNDLQQYSNIIALARTRRTELDRAIREVDSMGLVTQDRDRVLTPMRDERNEMLRVIATATEVR